MSAIGGKANTILDVRNVAYWSNSHIAYSAGNSAGGGRL